MIKKVLVALYKTRVVVMHYVELFLCVARWRHLRMSNSMPPLFNFHVSDFLDKVFSCWSVFSCSNCKVSSRCCASCWYWNVSVWLPSGWWLMISGYNAYYYCGPLVLFLVTIHKMLVYVCFFSRLIKPIKYSWFLRPLRLFLKSLSCFLASFKNISVWLPCSCIKFCLQ